VHELAVLDVLDVDDAPAVLASADGLAVDKDRALGADDGKGDEVLGRQIVSLGCGRSELVHTRIDSLS
jgi:hypothetical protein